MPENKPKTTRYVVFEEPIKHKSGSFRVLDTERNSCVDLSAGTIREPSTFSLGRYRSHNGAARDARRVNRGFCKDERGS